MQAANGRGTRALNCIDSLFRVFYREGDRPEQIERKRTVLLSLVVILFSLLPRIMVAGLSGGGHRNMWTLYISLTIVCTESVRCALTNGLSDSWLGFFLSCWAMMIAFHDLNVVAGDVYAGSRSWPFSIVILDAVILFRLPTSWAYVFIVCAGVFLFITDVDLKVRFGLLDAPFLPPYSERMHNCGCDKPPCPLGAGDWHRQPGLTGSLVTIVLDFLLTRSFAMQAQKEKTHLEQTVDASIKVATHLSTFNLDGAVEELVLHQQDMPPKLCRAFSKILARLRGYHAYVPAPAFHEMDDDNYNPEDTILQIKELGLNDIFQPVELLGSNEPKNQPASAGEAQEDTAAVRVRPRSSSAHPQSCFRFETVSLLAVNMQRSLDRVEAGLNAFLADHTEVLQQIMSSSSSNQGVLDRVVGDHYYVSFNASLSCATHCHAVVATASDIAAECSDVTMAVATGRAYCGSLGTAAFKIFSILGQLPLYLDGLLKAAPELGCRGGVIVAPLTRLSEDVRQSFIFQRVLRRVRTVGRDQHSVDAALWTLVTTEGSIGRRHEPWELYNRAVELLLMGNKYGAARLLEDAPEDVCDVYNSNVALLASVVIAY
eukprot:TRINITY_DN456_c2_g1_i1.p1 TRINITY_DN456_c2_g1~~TRINITY_DN456_c2_g1_i1.p1  ORF type:complete len:619 (+),score=91.90 TRINITY_DN456_c2_g1_i1:58-1857(+)